MISGDPADAVILNLNDEGRYGAKLERDVVGSDGSREVYVRIDGSGGEVWQSAPFFLITGALPDVETEIEQQYPTAVDQMLESMAEHNAAMYDQEVRIGEAAREAETQAAAAQDAAITARIQAGRAEEAAKRAEGLIMIGPEYAGMLLVVGSDGRAAPLRIGAGLAVIDGALVVTAAPGGKDVYFEALTDGSVRLAGVEFVDLGDGAVLLDGAEFTQQDDGSVLIR